MKVRRPKPRPRKVTLKAIVRSFKRRLAKLDKELNAEVGR